MRKLVAMCGLGLLLTGCGGNGAGSVGSLTGRWANKPVPGSSTDLVLQQSGSQVSGSGQYQIEAGRSGTLQVNGTASGTAVNMTLHYDAGFTTTFQGQFTDANHLSGTLQTSTGPVDNFVFVRQ